jgi:two-component system, NtrC family, C4-dicarboxylate transport sensor histidine kinase DctB
VAARQETPALLAGSATLAPPGSQAVSKLAARVAHELNNPLDAVLRFVSLAQRKARTGDYSDVERHLADAQFGLQRMAEILRELMDIGRQTHDIIARPLPKPLSELTAHALRTIAPQAEQKHVAVVVENSLPPQMTPRYDLRLSQVVANLLKNAVEASPENSGVKLSIQVAEGRLAISIEDSGPGINPDMIPQLFLPFVTTKPKGAGHGLGLAISRELVLSLGGTLMLDNRVPPDHGCIATILLPAS